ncbi:DUF1564 family protein [Leptospira fluminis]|uniref:DUF1564 family protein n=1 Tax=Leptospira fluminis TaxID=2484979 RepID=A0A4R9GRU3_9LEPT|nr:DUF1564 family protein [Leptospira fluminis]TGK20912.1 DUF1564 family protein [Leptospira fluminis]
MQWEKPSNPSESRSKIHTLKAKSPKGEVPNCTLLLSRNLYVRLLQHWEGEKPLSRCLNELLELYAARLEKGEKLNSESSLLLYQRKKPRSSENFDRINFRPEGMDWIRLGNISRWHGVSRCFLFSYMLELYFCGKDGESGGAARKRRAA